MKPASCQEVTEDLQGASFLPAASKVHPKFLKHQSVQVADMVSTAETS